MLVVVSKQFTGLYEVWCFTHFLGMLQLESTSYMCIVHLPRIPIAGGVVYSVLHLYNPPLTLHNLTRTYLTLQAHPFSSLVESVASFCPPTTEKGVTPNKKEKKNKKKWAQPKKKKINTSSCIPASLIGQEVKRAHKPSSSERYRFWTYRHCSGVSRPVLFEHSR